MKRSGYRRIVKITITCLEDAVLVLEIVAAWFGLSALGLVGAVGACRSGHAEDVALGYSD